MVDLGEVVVFGGQPEDRDVRGAGGAGGFGGAGDGGGGFEERKERTAEESDLLAGDDGAGSVAEEVDVREGGGGGVKGAGLGFEGVGKGDGVDGCRGRAVEPTLAGGGGSVPAADGSVGRGSFLICLQIQEVLIEAGGVQERDGVTLGAGFKRHASLLCGWCRFARSTTVRCAGGRCGAG